MTDLLYVYIWVCTYVTTWILLGLFSFLMLVVIETIRIGSLKSTLQDEYLPRALLYAILAGPLSIVALIVAFLPFP